MASMMMKMMMPSMPSVPKVILVIIMSGMFIDEEEADVYDTHD